MPRHERLRPGDRQPVSGAVLLLYNVVYLAGFAVYLPLFLWKMLWDRSYRTGIRERMGQVPATAGGDVIWVHGVSVGEVKAAAPLVDVLHDRLPGTEVVVSATTPTGKKVAQQLFGPAAVFYYPLDFWRFPARALDRVRPRCVLLMELELWPNFLHAAERRGVPVAVVNGRISERSWRGYRRVSRLLPQLDRIDLFSVQNTTYAERLEDLGVSREKIRTVGNLKYDSLAISDGPVASDPELRRLLGCDGNEAVLVAGSTHPGEEASLARIAARLERRLGRCVRLVVAPRHPERSGSAAEDLRRELRATGLGDRHAVLRLTTQREAAPAAAGGKPWLVVDTIGELEAAYSIADVVFVGGSLVRHGGQNMLEPVALGKPTVFGPHTWNFRTDVDLLTRGGGVLEVRGEESLEEQIAFLLSNPAAARSLVARAQGVLRENQGATRRTVDHVMRLLEDRVPDPGRTVEAAVAAGDRPRDGTALLRLETLLGQDQQPDQ